MVNTTLVNPAQFQLTPDVSPLTSQIMQALGKRAEIKRRDDIAASKLQAEKLQKDFKTTGDQMIRLRRIDDFNTKRSETAKLGQEAIKRGEDPKIYVDALNISNPDDFNLYLDRIATAAGNVDKVIDTGKKAQGMASAKTEILSTGATIQALPDKTVEVRNPQGELVTGDERIRVLEEAGESKLATKQKLADIDIRKSRDIAAATARQARISEIKKEFSASNRLAGRSERRLKEAETLARQATQGLSGRVKIGMGKLFPGIDTSDEAALASSLRGLALDQLQKFKGPTTDFEFGITESITGTLGDPKTANIARIKALQRNNYFVKKEADQFKEFVRSGGDPDEFAFNFQESVETKKGVFTLQQIQDTAAKNHLSIEDTLKRLNK